MTEQIRNIEFRVIYFKLTDTRAIMVGILARSGKSYPLLSRVFVYMTSAVSKGISNYINISICLT